MSKPDPTPVPERKRRRPATTPEGRESQMVSLAVDLAEQQLEAGTASAQVITHYLKLGTIRNTLEQEKLIQENKLLQARTEAIANQAKMEDLFAEAIRAMSRYQGKEPEPVDEDV